MHIAYFTNFYLPVVSGVVRSVQSFREALTAMGVDAARIFKNF